MPASRWLPGLGLPIAESVYYLLTKNHHELRYKRRFQLLRENRKRAGLIGFTNENLARWHEYLHHARFDFAGCDFKGLLGGRFRFLLSFL